MPSVSGDCKIKLYWSPITARTGIITANRSARGGLIRSPEEAVRGIEDCFNTGSYPCGTKEFLGLPYFEPTACAFMPGDEAKTTREYARVGKDGGILVHQGYVFPGERWISDKWLMRVMENKFPLADKEDFFTGDVYKNERSDRVWVECMDAKGKDYIIVTSPNHIVPAHSIDFYALTKLEQIFAKREIEDPDIEYVCIGSNNAGLPKKVSYPFIKEMGNCAKAFKEIIARLPPLLGEAGLESLLESIFKEEGLEFLLAPTAKMPSFNGDGKTNKEKVMKSLETVIKYSDGHYETAGYLSGASQPHPHARVLSLPIVPPWIKEIYRRTELKASTNEKTTFYDFLKNEGLLIKKGEYFVLSADPVPEYNGGLLIMAKKRQNIVEMSEMELKELAEMRKLARVMQEITFRSPSNDYMIQTFKGYTGTYPNTRFILCMVPRTNVQAFMELGTKIVGINKDPRQLAETMESLKKGVETKIGLTSAILAK